MKKLFLMTFIRFLLLTSISFSLLITACRQNDKAREYGWFDFTIPDLDSSATVVDMSFLNQGIAGSSGCITVKDGHFADGNGNRVRFFGTNLTFGSCFPEKEISTALAARLRKLGMNVMRFHHMDNQKAPGGIWDSAMKEFDAGQLDKLDWLVYQLKLHGIYSNINTHVSGNYPGSNYPEIEQFNYGKGIDQFYRPYIEMQKEYARKLLLHRNPYTGTNYAEEPAIAFVEVNNENSLLSNWALYPKLNDEHKAALNDLWKNWLGRNPEMRRNAAGKDLMWIISNYESTPDGQKEAMWAFLVDTEMSYAKEMVDYFRNELKVKAMISETQASYSGVAGILRESSYADYIDMHAYWEHPSFPGRSWSRTNWLIRNSSMVSDKKGGTLLRFGQHRVDGMPLAISEYDHPAPSFFCAEMYPMLNSVSAFQDFDAIYQFACGSPYNAGMIPGFFALNGHPLKQVFVPAGAVIFRMGTVKPGEHYIKLGLPEGSVISELVKTGGRLRLHGTNMNYIWDEAGSESALTLLHPVSVDTDATELKLSEKTDKPEGTWISETGEISWDNNDSINAVFKVNAPAARAAIGYIGGKNIDLGTVSVQMDTTTHNWATITLTSLDGKPLEESSKVLLVAAGRVENTGWKWDEKFTTLGGNWGKAPTRAEGIPAKLIFRDMDKFKVYALDPAGKEITEIDVRKERGDQVLNIGAQYETLWYILTRE
ncbi:MAG: hypothetical protein IQL11_05320 [Bacteroidales bacterium]|nr:hypothetical protein [Bacteroidales bacterium]